jgi:ABC-type nitrate/sulfonate/bicarbonate transport system substrate-binding protein
MRNRLIVVGLTLAVLFSPIIAFDSAGKDINLGWSGQGSWTTLPYIVAGERGLFDKEGLKIRLITFRGTNLMLTALLAGELDYATILPFLTGASARGLPVKILASVTKTSSYVIISRPEIDSVKALKGKKVGINSFGSSADYAAYAALSRSGLDPNKDLTILPIGGGSPERFAALTSGSVDATVVTSPSEYAAEKQGLRILVSARDLAELVRIPLTGIGATQKKMERDADEIVRVLRALRSATLLLTEKPDYAVGLFEKILRVDPPLADKLYKLYREQYNPELILPDSVVEDLLAVGTFRLKEKPKTAFNLQSIRDWSFAEKARR